MKIFNVEKGSGNETDKGKFGAFRGGKSSDGRDPSSLSGYEESGDKGQVAGRAGVAKGKPMMFALK